MGHHFPPDIPDEAYERMARLAASARALEAMSTAVHGVIAHIANYNDHKAVTYYPGTARYTLEPFLGSLHYKAVNIAEAALGSDTPYPPLLTDLQSAVVVPDWVNTARGALPPLNEPEWVRIWEPYERRDVPPQVAVAVALIADGRRPSLLRMDWDWAGVFPFATPAHEGLNSSAEVAA